MPILFTDEILAATEQPEAGWSYAEFVNYAERPNKNNTGVDYVFTFNILKGPGEEMTNRGRSVTMIIYGNAIAAKVAEECRKLRDFLCVIADCTAEELRNKTIDPSKYLGKKLSIKIVDEVYNGKLIKRVTEFSPDEIAVPF